MLLLIPDSNGKFFFEIGLVVFVFIRLDIDKHLMCSINVYIHLQNLTLIFRRTYWRNNK